MSATTIRGESVEYLSSKEDDDEFYVTKHSDGRYSFSIRHGEDWIDVIVAASDFKDILRGMETL